MRREDDNLLSLNSNFWRSIQSDIFHDFHNAQVQIKSDTKTCFVIETFAILIIHSPSGSTTGGAIPECIPLVHFSIKDCSISKLAGKCMTSKQRKMHTSIPTFFAKAN